MSNCVWIQKLYAAMHEPDGVAGVSAIRKAEPSLKEQILEHESIGLLRDATACYDRAIQLEPDQVNKNFFFSFLINIILNLFSSQTTKAKKIFIIF